MHSKSKLLFDENLFPFITYQNKHNPHITIHKFECEKVAQHGGIPSKPFQEYTLFMSYKSAEIYAEAVKSTSPSLEIKICSFCNPNI